MRYLLLITIALSIVGCGSTHLWTKAERAEQRAALDAGTRELVDARTVRNGMAGEAALLAWGMPDAVRNLETPVDVMGDAGGAQHVHATWNYRDGAELFIVDGVVSMGHGGDERRYVHDPAALRRSIEADDAVRAALRRKRKEYEHAELLAWAEEQRRG